MRILSISVNMDGFVSLYAVDVHLDGHVDVDVLLDVLVDVTCLLYTSPSPRDS